MREEQAQLTDRLRKHYTRQEVEAELASAGHPSKLNLSRANLKKIDLSGLNLSGANLSGAYLWGANLSRANLTGTRFTAAALISADLTGANLTQADLSKAVLVHANCTQADLSRALLVGANLSECTLDHAKLNGANLSGVDLSRVALTNVRFDGVSLSEINLNQRDLRGINLSGAIMSRIDLSKRDLTGANLSGANLSGANLLETNFYKAYLSGAMLRGANLTAANLRDTTLIGADLTEADLTRAILSGANLSRSTLKGADFTSVNIPVQLKERLLDRGIIGLQTGPLTPPPAPVAPNPEPLTVPTQEPGTLRLHFKGDPLSATEIATLLTNLNELHARCWLIAQNRELDIINYLLTGGQPTLDETRLNFQRLETSSNPPCTTLELKPLHDLPGLITALTLALHTTSLETISTDLLQPDLLSLDSLPTNGAPEDRVRQELLQFIRDRLQSNPALAATTNGRHKPYPETSHEIELLASWLYLLSTRKNGRDLKKVHHLIDLSQEIITHLRPNLDKTTHLILARFLIAPLTQLAANPYPNLTLNP